MGLIQVLNEVTSNQIAAGEVVERPASVAKELIENALDAGATQIDVQIEEGGVRKLVILDNGSGMASDDALLCFSRYATSKIKSVSDLSRLTSFGFRGEALASIASVSKVTLTTRMAGQSLATQVICEGGKTTYLGESGGSVGTRLEVESLFYNTPARLKFLKTPRSESGAVENVVREAALSHPEVGFRFQVDAKLKLDARVANSPERQIERVLSCLGDDCREYLYPIEAQTDLLKLSGYLVAPLATRKDSSGVYVYVNNRYVRDRQLVQAIKVAYRTLLEVGRHPICVLNLDIDPEVVDVNVHPQKLEVRFSEASRVQSHLIRLLSDFLATTPWLKREQPQRVYELRTEPSAYHFELQPEPEAPTLAQPDRSSVPTPPAVSRPVAAQVPKPAQHTLGGALRYADLRVVGQVDQTYLLLASESSLVVLDQHAAHERVVFERVCQQARENQIPSQPLLFPVSLKLSPAEMNTLIEKKDQWLPFGFEVEPFGEQEALIKAAPMGVDSEWVAEIVRDTLSDLAQSDRPDSLTAFFDHVCAQIACHTSVRAGQRLRVDEIQALLDQLDVVDYAAHCPHGRPVVHAIPFREMAQWFHRP
ncbi:MAG: DNA mismatch repair endonuclease MutL [Myxococcaceae bacterium]|nr:DNA mismatch repair endonuclease MutL [Myxococcaceae bacterium]MBH2006433.1 DNA mismatch repair endonuclease MutL [Myxococcaceae bacterium]